MALRVFLPWVVPILLFLSASCDAQPDVTRNAGPLSMRSIEDLNQKGVGPLLIGGKEAKSVDWPASFYSGASGSRCSATLVGPKVLLLAAHCVGNDQPVTITFRGATLSGPCTHHPDYRDGAGDRSADYALCRLNAVANDIPYETPNRDPTKVVRDHELLLTGYGCTVLLANGGPPTGGNDGKFRIGNAKVVALPGDTTGEPNTIITRDKVVVCPGDSGGGSYLVLTPKRRRLVSVNSRVVYANGESYLSSVSTTAAQAFFAKWIADNGNERICGMNYSESCR